MGGWRVVALAVVASVFVEAKWLQQHKREVIPNICDPANNTTKVHCYCTTDSRKAKRSANCHLVDKTLLPDDNDWEAFEEIKNHNKITFSNTMGISLTYVPTNAIKHMTTVMKLDIKHGNIEKVHSYAFANLTLVEEIILSNNQIKTLAANAFAHHRDLSSIGLDTNDLTEINRDVFVDLPSLEKLFLTNNKITTIHDRAFIHLFNLRELEIDRNGIFSLNSESFSGLKKLQKLDLSGNNLEVIGDNTFLPLTDLKSLNLNSNKIQMLDEKAFHGLANLNTLSLGHNNMTNIGNVKVFEGLDALKVLTLRSNQLVELKASVIAPILQNFYGNSSSLDVEENNFPCDCRLEWFMLIINKTQNRAMKIATENLQCIPDAKLKETWAKIEETEKREEEETQTQPTDYEYYDDVQLNGKLFYIDVRDLINCTGRKTDTVHTPVTLTTTVRTTSSLGTTPKIVSTTTRVTTPKTTAIELHSTEATIKTTEHTTVKVFKESTTMRVTTVSEKPVDNFDHDMASDEARTEKATKAHRSIQDDVKDTSRQTSKANRNVSVASAIFIVISLRLCF